MTIAPGPDAIWRLAPTRSGAWPRRDLARSARFGRHDLHSALDIGPRRLADNPATHDRTGEVEGVPDAIALRSRASVRRKRAPTNGGTNRQCWPHQRLRSRVSGRPRVVAPVRPAQPRSDHLRRAGGNVRLRGRAFDEGACAGGQAGSCRPGGRPSLLAAPPGTATRLRPSPPRGEPAPLRAGEPAPLSAGEHVPRMTGR
jgi:hypothetical protein